MLFDTDGHREQIFIIPATFDDGTEKHLEVFLCRYAHQRACADKGVINSRDLRHHAAPMEHAVLAFHGQGADVPLRYIVVYGVPPSCW